VQKWRKRMSTADARVGPKTIRSTVLTAEEEALIVAFGRHVGLDPGLVDEHQAPGIDLTLMELPALTLARNVRPAAGRSRRGHGVQTHAVLISAFV
jgi:hypothetical protein